MVTTRLLLAMCRDRNAIVSFLAATSYEAIAQIKRIEIGSIYPLNMNLQFAKSLHTDGDAGTGPAILIFIFSLFHLFSMFVYDMSQSK
jgi:hypothetical protein